MLQMYSPRKSYRCTCKYLSQNYIFSTLKPEFGTNEKLGLLILCFPLKVFVCKIRLRRSSKIEILQIICVASSFFWIAVENWVISYWLTERGIKLQVTETHFTIKFVSITLRVSRKLVMDWSPGVIRFEKISWVASPPEVAKKTCGGGLTWSLKSSGMFSRDSRCWGAQPN